MIQFKKTIPILTLVVFAFGCKSGKNAGQESNTTNTKKEAKEYFSGTYAGIAPCGDCDGIQQVIDLSQNGRYSWEQIFLNTKKTKYTSTGNLVWDTTGTIIEMKHPQLETSAFYKVTEGLIFQIDKEGNAVKGTKYQTYSLDKCDLDMLKKKWLIPLQTDDTLRHKPSKLNFNLDEMSITGTTGCNNFKGSFKLLGNNKIQFEKINTTYISCIDAKRESDFLLGLYRSVSYKLGKKTFILYDEKMNTTLTFELNTNE